MAHIGILHYQIGKTDGVSLEIEKRMKVLDRLGHTVRTVAGSNQERADYVIPELDIVQWIEHHQTFELRSLEAYQEAAEKLSHRIYHQFKNIVGREKFDVLYIHNILGLGRHPASAKAIVNVLDESPTPTVAIHHDLYWEREDIMEQANQICHHLFEQYHVPHRPFIRHEVINSLAQRSVLQQRNIHPVVVPDMFDFDQPLWEKGPWISELRQDLGISEETRIVLQATRIVPRKGIEMAIDYAAQLQKNIGQPCALVLSNYPDTAEKSALEYLDALKIKAKQQDVTLIEAYRLIRSHRIVENNKRHYTFWDMYAAADLITYPSLVEGWGNQFLEAVFARKLPVVFEYPVFKSDILPQGYQVISLGDSVTKKDSFGLFVLDQELILQAVQQTIAILTNPDLHEALVSHNFAIAKQNHSLQRLHEHLERQILEMLPTTVTVAKRIERVNV